MPLFNFRKKTINIHMTERESSLKESFTRKSVANPLLITKKKCKKIREGPFSSPTLEYKNEHLTHSWTGYDN